MRKPPFKVKYLKYRRIRAIDPLPFASDITNSDLGAYLRSLNIIWMNLFVSIAMWTAIDKNALLKTNIITVRPEAPWMKESIFSARKERHRLKRRWRLSWLTTDREILQNQIQRMKIMLLTARSTYYADKMHEEAGNPLALLHTVGSLLHTNHARSRPPWAVAQQFQQ